MQAFRETLTPAHSEFFSQMFVPLAWYDVLPINASIEACASILNISPVEHTHRRSAWHAEQDMRGLYKAILKVSSPEAVCRRFASIYSQLYDFGHVKILETHPNSVDACAYGMPEVLAEWWMRASEAYMATVLSGAGAKQPKLIWKPLEPDGTLCGMPLVRVPSTTVWK